MDEITLRLGDQHLIEGEVYQIMGITTNNATGITMLNLDVLDVRTRAKVREQNINADVFASYIGGDEQWA